jgi:hypothetical protein
MVSLPGRGVVSASNAFLTKVRHLNSMDVPSCVALISEKLLLLPFFTVSVLFV